MGLVLAPSSTLKNQLYGGQNKNWWTSRVNFGLDPPEGPPIPLTPTHYPYQDKKGTNLLHFKFCILTKT